MGKGRMAAWSTMWQSWTSVSTAASFASSFEASKKLACTDSERREAAFRTPDAKQLHADVFGAAENYGWSLSTARRLAIRERLRFAEYVRGHGFALL